MYYIGIIIDYYIYYIDIQQYAILIYYSVYHIHYIIVREETDRKKKLGGAANSMQERPYLKTAPSQPNSTKKSFTSAKKKNL